MKLFKILLVNFLLFSITSHGQDFYDIENIHSIEITFVESNWDQILDQYYAAGDEERLVGSVMISGEFYDSVGVRYKGNSTYNANQVKNPLNIKLDHIIDDQTIDGYGTLKLANVFKDPSFVREVLGYEIARKYFPASLANFANVYINGTHMGLYTSDQSVDKFFAQTHYGSEDNAYFKGEITDGKMPTGGVWEYYGEDSSSYQAYYDMKSDYGWSDLINFTDILNNNSEDVEEVLNIDRHLWFIAYSNLLVNLDGPINNPQNHYIYKDNNVQFNVAPWDLNECFGVFTMHQTLGPLNTSQLQQFSPYANINEADFPIISKILSNDNYKKIYVAHMKTMIEENFSDGQLESRANEIQDIIANDVMADPNKFYTYYDFTNNVNNEVGFGPHSIIGLTQLMDSRISYLMSLSDFQYEAPEITNVTHNNDDPEIGAELWINAQVANCDNVELAYRNNSFGVFEKTEMFDDGQHEDGAAGDGVYGVSIIVTSTIQYYIYAENANAVAFNPVRAEYEFYEVAVSSDVVINEFMADNESTVADPAGEYDDWIEFFNNSNENINLDGYYLTDDPNELDKWMFPDTSIMSNDYLIVWADKDEDQEGLHASIKLSADGEMIVLSDGDMNIIDEVSFGPQKPDTTTGRFPNGTGYFIEMLPTFGSENYDNITGIGDNPEIVVVDFKNYPNPFSQTTNITFSLEKQSAVTLEVYDIYGQKISEIVSSDLIAGTHNFQWYAGDKAKGFYVCRLVANGVCSSLKMIVQ